MSFKMRLWGVIEEEIVVTEAPSTGGGYPAWICENDRCLSDQGANTTPHELGLCYFEK